MGTFQFSEQFENEGTYNSIHQLLLSHSSPETHKTLKTVQWHCSRNLGDELNSKEERRKHHSTVQLKLRYYCYSTRDTHGM